MIIDTIVIESEIGRMRRRARAHDRPDEASMRARESMRDARIPLLHRKTPAVTAGGGKREAVVRAAGGDERDRMAGPGGE